MLDKDLSSLRECSLNGRVDFSFREQRRTQFRKFECGFANALTTATGAEYHHMPPNGAVWPVRFRERDSKKPRPPAPFIEATQPLRWRDGRVHAKTLNAPWPSDQASLP